MQYFYPAEVPSGSEAISNIYCGSRHVAGSEANRH